MSYTLKVVLDSTDGTVAAGTEVQAWTLNEVVVNHGRQSISEDVPPSNASLSFIWDNPGAPDLDGFIIGRRVNVWLYIDGAAYPLALFDGSVTDVVVVDTALSVVAVNRALAEIGRQTVTLGSGFNDDVAGALTTLYALGSQDPRLGTTQGTTDVRIEAFDTENLLGIMREVAASEIGGYLTQSMPWGPTVVGFTTGPHVINRTVADRSQLTPDITFTGDEIVDAWSFSRRMEDFVNRVTVYGTEDGTDFPDGFWVEDNTPSIDAYGLNELQIQTRIRYENDAETPRERQARPVLRERLDHRRARRPPRHHVRRPPLRRPRRPQPRHLHRDPDDLRRRPDPVLRRGDHVHSGIARHTSPALHLDGRLLAWRPAMAAGDAYPDLGRRPGYPDMDRLAPRRALGDTHGNDSE
jgi:hypothetical protein